MTANSAVVPGPVLFARYAFPPNSHGFCGPPDHGGFFEYGVAGRDDGGLRAMAQQFAGAWPYLQLIAGATGLDDPLDRRVVEAYWVGSPRLDQVGTRAVGDSMEDRFRAVTAGTFSTLTEGVLAGGVPHHSFAVFCIYPYTGLLTEGRKAPHALTVLDRCRIRWGRVLAVQGDQVVVQSRPLTWDGGSLGLGPPETETVVQSVDGVGMVGTVHPGDWVSLHWEWVCDTLTEQQVGRLRRYTEKHLAIVNDRHNRSRVPALLD
ncbi:DUF6390 family protein [Blastococcus saxobsidens]|uniref:Uncharacterized protein n=1 Tax=Blastococcus saxobsidens (strain DD2) TaxID=1146883 RepID=H6RNI1_BLASD|nr:DUF6390 family protein [Blastococcus saxobsidens]CCG03928.1 conserved protein of unknown function [Blastococcus saxobsidens DD2]